MSEPFETSPGKGFHNLIGKLVVSDETWREFLVKPGQVFAEYGIEYPVPFGSYEIDHLIPLSLGGSNEVANLWPKAAEPWPGFYEKNITGNYLLAEVCAGNIDLSIAQKRIASDWFLIYSNLSESTVKELKNKYKNWAARKP